MGGLGPGLTSWMGGWKGLGPIDEGERERREEREQIRVNSGYYMLSECHVGYKVLYVTSALNSHFNTI